MAVAARRRRGRRTNLALLLLLSAAIVTGGLAFAIGGDWVRWAVVTHGLAGAHRRATGSYQHGSFAPDAMPVTQWLNDGVPTIDEDRWILHVVDDGGEREIAYGSLTGHADAVRAVIDCTGGWYAEQEWEGVVLADLLVGHEHAASIDVSSSTGYRRRFPAADAGRLLLATRVGGRPLSAGHGFPVRLVAPGRRGVWWGEG